MPSSVGVLPAMDLEIDWEEKTVAAEEKMEITALLQEGIRQALVKAGGPDKAEVGLVLADDQTIRDLNRKFRGVDRPTDVLSFAMLEKGEGEPDIYDQDDQENLILGDIVISIERARSQAKEFGHSLAREIIYLAVHGTLHLLGYDHQAEEEGSEMRRLEEQVMAGIGLSR